MSLSQNLSFLVPLMNTYGRTPFNPEEARHLLTLMERAVKQGYVLIPEEKRVKELMVSRLLWPPNAKVNMKPKNFWTAPRYELSILHLLAFTVLVSVVRNVLHWLFN